MNGGDVNEITVDMEVCDIVCGKVDVEATTGRSTFKVVIKAYGRGIVEKKVCC